MTHMAKTRWPRPSMSGALLLAGLFALLAIPSSRGVVLPVQADSAPPDRTVPTALEVAAARPAAVKVDPQLGEQVATGDDGAQIVVVTSYAPVDLSAYGRVLHRWTWPAGEHIALVRTTPKQVLAIAALPQVATVRSGDPEQQRPLPEDFLAEERPAYAAVPATEMRALLDKAPAWSATQGKLARQAEERRWSAAAATGGPRPTGWHDIGPGHAASEAWGMGYDGEGVRVAVLDTSVDFGHPDLQGTAARLPASHPYAGWPQLYDPYALYLHVLDLAAVAEDPDADQNSKLAIGGLIQTYQQSDVVEKEIDGTMYKTACFQGLSRQLVGNALGPRILLPEDCNFKVPESKSGKVRFGHHPDGYLFGLGARPADQVPGEFAGVLLVDADEAGVYDTVYVDINANHDFTDEKPVTKESPESWRDIDADGVADLSAGALYFIADGIRAVPGAYLWEDEETTLGVQPAASMVAFHYDVGQHGTLCASNVVSQGRLGVPPGTTLSYRDSNPALNADGAPEAINPGMAPKAGMVAIGSVYSGPALVMQSAWRYGVFGDDPENPDDDPQITSNSYGYSGTDNDYWDPDSRYIDYYVRQFNPNVSFLFSTGNGGPGYGTLAPPSATVGMGIAASTQLSSTGWDSAYETSQITFGDLITWSNRGPGANGTNGVNVAADGAYAAGGQPINMVTTNANLPEGRRNGLNANSTWGGTSRSSPVAAGLLALEYQAFREANGRWPRYDEARAIFQAGARYAGYDTLTMGSGIADAGNAARIAAGKGGIYALPSEWAAGSYEGERHDAFAQLVSPGQTVSTTITLHNPSDKPVTATVQGQTLRRVGSETMQWKSEDVAKESAYRTHLTAPNYLLPIDKTKIPAGTDLMVVRRLTPLRQVDLDGNLTVDNSWTTLIYQHTDWNDNQKLWNDANGDGVVNFAYKSPDEYQGLDFIAQLDFAQSEIEEGEYQRFNYSNSTSSVQTLTVHHPLQRWGSGMYIGLVHICTPVGNPNCNGRPAALPQTDFQFRLDFYQYSDWDWLALAGKSVSVAAGGEASLDLKLTVPEQTPYGLYQGAVFLDYDRPEGDEPVTPGGGYELENYRMTIPVVASVAASYDWQGAVSLGGAGAADPDSPYDNGTVGGHFIWTWRAESGDWRYYFVDAEAPPRGTYWITKTTWEDANEQQADIDTLLYGLTKDRYSDPNHPDNGGDDWSDPLWYGPGTMALVTKSRNRNLGGGRWAFDTSSGGNEDWLAAPARGGLHEVLLHNVLFSGAGFSMPFETSISSLQVIPEMVMLYGDGCADVSFRSQIALPGFSAGSYGLSEPLAEAGVEIQQDDANSPASASYKKELDIPSETARFRVAVDGQDGDDLDLFVLYDANQDGELVYPAEVVGQSTSPTADEVVALGGFQPAGKYGIWVQGWSVPAGTSTFDIEIDIVYGENLKLSNAPDEAVPGQLHSMQVCADPESVSDMAGPLYGIVTFGPAGAPALVQVPVTWLKERPPVPNIYLPYATQGHELLPPAMEPAAGMAWVTRPAALRRPASLLRPSR